MRSFSLITLLWTIVTLPACQQKDDAPDAYGNFEAVETIVSAEATGELQSFTIEEGQTLRAGKLVGQIDPVQLQLKKDQVQASTQALEKKIPNISAQLSAYENQIAVQEQQLTTLEREHTRIQNLWKEGATFSKQVDDIVAQIELVKKQIALSKQQRTAQASALTTQKSGTAAEEAPLQAQVKQIDDQLKHTAVVNPKAGTVLVKYAEVGEVATYGKPLYKLGDLEHITLRAFMAGTQLTRVKVGQQVKIQVDGPDGKLISYSGTVTWIADKAEFTPKVIQTRDERVNLVYAFKVQVKNDGSLKIGMPGEVKF